MLIVTNTLRNGVGFGVGFGAGFDPSKQTPPRPPLRSVELTN